MSLSLSFFFFFFLKQLNYLALTPGKSLNLPKTKNLFLFYLFQTNLLTSRRPSLLMVSPLWFLSACLRWPLVFRGGVPADNDLGQWIPAFEVGSRPRAALDFGRSAFLFRRGWYGRHVSRSALGFDVRRIFWWLDLVCAVRLVGLMFNTCYHSSIHVLLIGSNRMITALSLGILHYLSLLGACGPVGRAAPPPRLVIHMFSSCPAHVNLRKRVLHPFCCFLARLHELLIKKSNNLFWKWWISASFNWEENSWFSSCYHEYLSEAAQRDGVW